MERQIYYHDTDSGGVIYYANYLKYLEEARTEYLDKMGLGMRAFLDRGLFYAVRSCNITYKAPGRYGDVICCDAKVAKFTGAQVIFQQRVWNKVNDQTLAEAEVTIVCLDKNFKPTPLPADIRGKML